MNMQNIGYRQIRSFVRRQGRLSIQQRDALKNLWEDYGLNIATGELDFTVIYDRVKPVILEIGFGMGDSLLSMAQLFPEHDFIGIEVHTPGIGSLLAAVNAKSIKNIRVFQEDANLVLKHCIPDNSLSGIQIFFPDPWPKKRHQKRRLIQPEFLNLLNRKLKSGGQLHLATDWQDYATHMMKHLSAMKEFNNLAGEGKYSHFAQRPLTKYEQRGKNLGHEIWDLLFEKISM